MIRISRRMGISRAFPVLRPRGTPPATEDPGVPRPASGTTRDVLACATLTLTALVSRVAYIVGTLEQWDTVNFALALDRFDPVRHQPHPPGQVLFVAVARLLRIWTADNVHAVSLANALLGSLALVPFYGLVHRWTDPPTAWLAGLLFIVNPCLWLNSIRPLSDGAALFPMLTAVVLLLSDRPRQALAGYFMVGLALGFRQQLAFPLGPFLAYVGTRHVQRFRWTFALQAGLLLLLSVGTWLIPTLMAVGGPAPYWQASRSVLRYVWEQESLARTWSMAHFRTVFALTFETVWGWPWLAGITWVLIGIGLQALRSDPGRFVPWLTLTVPAVAWRFLMLWHHERYAVSYLPLLIVPLALGIHRVGHWVWKRWPTARLEILSWIGLVLVGGQVMFVFPTVDDLRRHHAPVQKAARWIAERYETGQTLVITDDRVIHRHLDYYGPRIGVAVRHETQLSPDVLRAHSRWLLLVANDRPELGFHLVAQWEWRPGIFFRLEPQRNLRTRVPL